MSSPRAQAAAFRQQAAGLHGNAAAAQDLRSQLGSGGRGQDGRGQKRDRGGRPVRGGDVSSDEEPPDEVRLYEAGWKERYYQVGRSAGDLWNEL